MHWTSRARMLFMGGAGWILLAACAAPLPMPQPAEAVPGPTPTAVAAASAQDSEMTVESMRFDGRNTFLSWVSDVLATEGTPAARGFVEVTDRVGVVWQGERLHATGQEIWLLQPARRGGVVGVRVASAAGAPEVAEPAADVAARVAAQLPAVDEDEVAAPDVEIRFVRARLQDGRWSFDVTLAHPDTGWDDYTDGWQIETPEGEILGVRILLHPHETEQPFTRSLSGVEVPATVDTIVVRAHDLVSGYGPGSVQVPLAEPLATDAYEVIR